MYILGASLLLYMGTTGEVHADLPSCYCSETDVTEGGLGSMHILPVPSICAQTLHEQGCSSCLAYLFDSSNS